MVVSLITVILITHLLLIFAHLFNIHCKGISKLSVIYILILFLLTSDKNPYSLDGFFSPEQAGHIKEIEYRASLGGFFEYSIFEPLKTFFMQIAYITDQFYLFDFLFKLSYSSVLIYMLFFFNSKKESYINNKNKIKEAYFFCAILLFPAVIYGGVRQSLSSLLCLSTFIIYFASEDIKKISLIYLPTAPHSVGFLSVAIFLPMLFYSEIKSKFFVKNRIIILIVLAISCYFVLNQMSSLLANDSNYLFNKNVDSYIIQGAGNTVLWFGVPRSFFGLPLVIALIYLFFDVKNILFLKKQVLSFLFILFILMGIGLIISPQVSARFVGFTQPLILFIILTTYYKTYNFRIIKALIVLFFTLKCYYEPYRLSVSDLDLFGLPIIYSYFN